METVRKRRYAEVSTRCTGVWLVGEAARELSQFISWCSWCIFHVNQGMFHLLYGKLNIHWDSTYVSYVFTCIYFFGATSLEALWKKILFFCLFHAPLSSLSPFFMTQTQTRLLWFDTFNHTIEMWSSYLFIFLFLLRFDFELTAKRICTGGKMVGIKIFFMKVLN